LNDLSTIAHIIVGMFKDDILPELTSRSGLSYRSYTSNNSTFDTIWEDAAHKLKNDFANILTFNYDDLDKALQEYRDKFICTFMISLHKYVIKHSKFNWND